MSLWQGLKWYYEVCGNRGICAIASFRLFGKPREISIVPSRSSCPVFLRIDTSDFCAYRDVLAFQTKSYDPGISNFAPKIIVDAGAHIGMASIFFALKYPAARIFAIEPESIEFRGIDQEHSLLQGDHANSGGPLARGRGGYARTFRRPSQRRLPDSTRMAPSEFARSRWTL